MKMQTKKAFVIAIIAGILVLLDGIIANLFNQDASFTWVAFVSWTVFFGESTKERLKAVVGYVLGFLAAIVIIKLGALSNIVTFNIFGVAIVSILATMLVNFLVMELELIKKWFPISVSGMFVGIAMTFSGLGVGLNTSTFESAMLLLALIVVYGVMGLISGWATLYFTQEKENK